MKPKKDSEIILSALQTVPSATARELVNMTELTADKTSAAIHHLISSGKVFVIGEVYVIPTKRVNLYSATKLVTEDREITQQNWLSPLMQ